MLLAVVLDNLFVLPPTARWICLVAGAVRGSAALWFGLLARMPLRARDERLAAYYEERVPETDNRLIDDAMKEKVILCSPVTLFAVLAVIRQAMDTFRLERTASEVFSLLASFNKQWQKYRETMDKMGSSLDKAVREYQHLVTTRSNVLERPLRQIEALRESRAIPDGAEPETVPLSLKEPPEEDDGAGEPLPG